MREREGADGGTRIPVTGEGVAGHHHNQCLLESTGCTLRCGVVSVFLLYSPEIVPEEARDKRRHADLVEHVVVDEPVLEGLVVNHCGARMVPEVKPARSFAAVASRRSAIAVAVGVPAIPVSHRNVQPHVRINEVVGYQPREKH